MYQPKKFLSSSPCQNYPSYNCWLQEEPLVTFAKLQFELISLCYYANETLTNKVFGRTFNKSFKEIFGLGKTIPAMLVSKLSGYQLKDRAKML